jgi:glucose-6-phosphate 1-epimerase
MILSKDFYSILPSGQKLLHISNKFGSATIALQGAHIIDWSPVSSNQTVLFLSPTALFESNVAIRGGSPICWPWFGDKLYNKAHGFARISSFEVEEINHSKDFTKATLKFINEEKDYLKISLKVIFTLGTDLIISTTTQNNSPSDFEFTQALHTYFKISNIQNVVIKGLLNQTYHDKTDSSIGNFNNDELKITKETDLIVSNSPIITILDPQYSRRIQIKSSGATNLVIWNPWIEKSKGFKDLPQDAFLNFICVESANISTNVALSPGESHTSSQSISIENF